MSYKESVAEEFPEPETSDEGINVAIYRKVEVTCVHVTKSGTVPFEAAVLMQLGEALSATALVHGSKEPMNDRYEATYEGRSVLVKLGDYATEDEL